jgi:hypothetical protein
MIDNLLKQLDMCQMKVDGLLVECDRPGSEEVERLRIWEGAQIPEKFALLDVVQIFDRLKPFAVARGNSQSWFEFIRWVLWN